MQRCRELAGFSYGRADLVRRAMSKKKAKVMQQEREHFIYGMKREDGTVECPGCIANGVPESIANEIFDEMSSFASYAFNKSHAAAYAYVAYQTAYLKCHYPKQYMAALMTSVISAQDSALKIAGYIAVCNALLEDSDVALASEIVTAIGGAIAKALDKAILFGTGTRMPQGIVPRLDETEEPADYPATARAWVDLHESNEIAIAAGTTGAELFASIVTASGAAKGKYARGEKVWVMNEATYTMLISNALTINAAGQIVAGVSDRMPVIGGIIEVLDFVPDNMIIGGYFELYLLAERAGQKFATSEHYRFLADQTVMKGTARYDGVPVIPEAFVVITIGTAGSYPTFAPDTANT